MADSEHRAPRDRLPVGNDVVRRACCPEAGSDTPDEEFMLDRDGQLPLQFVGRLVGSNACDPGLPRGTFVQIFITRAGKIVTSVWQWQRAGGRGRERKTAAFHDTPEAALAWLVEDGRGKLGRASCEAWTQASTNTARLRKFAVERID